MVRFPGEEFVMFSSGLFTVCGGRYRRYLLAYLPKSAAVFIADERLGRSDRAREKKFEDLYWFNLLLMNLLLDNEPGITVLEEMGPFLFLLALDARCAVGLLAFCEIIFICG